VINYHKDPEKIPNKYNEFYRLLKSLPHFKELAEFPGSHGDDYKVYLFKVEA
jgi:hypothetical protein